MRQLPDPDSRDWRIVKGWAEERLAGLDRRNRGNLDQIETARVRGEISALMALLELGGRRQAADVETPPIYAVNNGESQRSDYGN